MRPPEPPPANPAAIPFPDRRHRPRLGWAQARWRYAWVWRHADYASLELMLGLHAALWGCWLLGVRAAYLLGWTDRDAMMSNPAYGPMRLVAGRVGLPGSVYWGTLALALGLLVLIGYAKSSARTRCAAAAGLGGLWTFAAVCYIWADWRTTATVSVPVYAGTGVYVARRVYLDAYRRKLRQSAEHPSPRAARLASLHRDVTAGEPDGPARHA